MRLVWSFVTFAVLLTGCRSADRTIILPEALIEVQPPIHMGHGRIPVAATKDGRYVAVLEANDLISVLELDSLKEIASIHVPQDSKSTPIFSLDGKALLLDQPSGRVAWRFATGALNAVKSERPEVSILHESMGGWNVDRTIGFQAPMSDSAGQAMFASGACFRIPNRSVAGFDSFGRLWVDNSCYDATGNVVATPLGNLGKPQVVPDQTRLRGGMRLEAVEINSTYKGSEAPLTCIWLVHDRAVKAKGQKRPALIFAGPDVYQWMFVPGRNMVFVYTSTGSFFVPFALRPRPLDGGDEKPGRDRKDRRG